jgi:predicted nucleotidyltransferase
VDLELSPIRRIGARYNDVQLASEFPSATALREAISRGEAVTSYLPNESAQIFLDATSRYGIADTSRLGSAMLARLRVGGECQELADLGGGLLEHLQKVAMEATDYETLCRASATKRYTNGRIRRSLLYLLAGVRKEDLDAHPSYVRLLAASETGREYLSKTRKTRTVPVVTKQADIASLGDMAMRARVLGARSDALWSLAAEKPISPAKLMAIPPFMAE